MRRTARRSGHVLEVEERVEAALAHPASAGGGEPSVPRPGALGDREPRPRLPVDTSAVEQGAGQDLAVLAGSGRHDRQPGIVRGGPGPVLGPVLPLALVGDQAELARGDAGGEVPDARRGRVGEALDGGAPIDDLARGVGPERAEDDDGRQERHEPEEAVEEEELERRDPELGAPEHQEPGQGSGAPRQHPLEPSRSRRSVAAPCAGARSGRGRARGPAGPC